jgi:hypothetical protein
MKKLLLCFLALMLVVILAFAISVIMPTANAPNHWSESWPAECAVIGTAVLAVYAVAVDTSQPAGLVARSIKRTVFKLLHAIGKVSRKLSILQRNASYRPATGKSPEWGMTRIKPIPT